MMNSSILTNGTTNELGGINMINVLTVKGQLTKAIERAIENNTARVVLLAAQSTLKFYNEGLRTEEDLVKAIAMLNVERSTAKIDSQELLVAFAKLLKSKDYRTILSVYIERDKFGKLCGSVTSTSVPVGRAFIENTVEDTIVVPVGTSGFQVITENSFAPFIKDFISIKFNSTNDIQKAKDSGVYVLYAQRETTAFIKNERTGEWTDVRNNKSYSMDELKELVNELEGDIRLQKCFVYSPSDIRNFGYAAKDVTNGDDRDEYLNRISNGGWGKTKVMLEKMIAAGKTDEEIQLFILKTMPRFGQLKAGSLNIGTITSWGYLTENFKTTYGETLDGTGFFDAEFIAECFTEILGIEVTQEAVVGMFLQARPDMQKGAYEVLDHVAFVHMYNKMKKTNPKFTVVGSESDKMPVMIVDDNVVKVASCFNKRDICLELLEIAGCSKAHMSKQAFEKILFADLEASMKFGNKLGQTHINDKIAGQFLKSQCKIPTIGEVNKCYVPDLTLSIDPARVNQSIPLHKSAKNNTVQSCINAVDKMKFDIAGNNVRLTSDAAEIILCKQGCSVIKFGEIYMPAAVEYFTKYYKEQLMAEAKEKGYTGQNLKNYIIAGAKKISGKINATLICMIKYPSMGPKEYYLANVLTLDVIFARIDAMDLEAEEKDVLKRYYAGTGKGLAKLPANKVVMFQCAGLDYDYDGATFIYDQEYVGILSKPGHTLEATLIASNKEIAEMLGK